MLTVPPPRQPEAAYLDFVEGLRIHNFTKNVRAALDWYRIEADRRQAAGQPPPGGMAEAGALIEGNLSYRFACSIQRHAQQMAWRTARESLEPHRTELTRAISIGPDAGVGRLEIDPDFVMPSWYHEAGAAQVDDIHLEPYWGDDLLGAVYQLGGGVYRLCWRGGYDPGPLLAFARSARARPDARILDLGCSFGTSTSALRLGFPEAEEVVGIDLSAEALRWAHLSAEDAGLAITYAQRDATDTGYPDASFDLVAGFLFLHEVPPDVLDATIREAFRLLRPGGHLMFLDIPPYVALAPEVAYVQSFDQRGNGERYWDGFLSRDFPGVLRNAGFVNVNDGPLDYEDPPYWGSAALMRTGEFRPENRWVTHADRDGRS